MRRIIYTLIILVCLTSLGGIFLYTFLPINRAGVTSELIMLGDLNYDQEWDVADKEELERIIASPFEADHLTLDKIDVNRNQLIEEEDLRLLAYLYRYSDPYVAEEAASRENLSFPRPRELFKYLPRYEYVQRPLYGLSSATLRETPLSFLYQLTAMAGSSPYEGRLIREIYDEGIRFTSAYTRRKDALNPIERNYAVTKFNLCNRLFEQGEYYELLLQLIGLVEDAETLTTASQSDFIKKILFFRDHLQQLLTSDEFEEFSQGRLGYAHILARMEERLKEDLGIVLGLSNLSSPRDLLKLENYLDRAEWQKYKNMATKEDFEKLILFAQYDRRYLRAVSKTSPRLRDIQLQNHNLPMILLFREALRIKGGDKKAAVGLLDESLRIPLGWVKSIPTELLPSSVALENFLLPGNKEDGSDKSRHWNVFGGITLYKSPEESLVLALKRENKDLDEDHYSVEAMREFIRDTIANINGIYYVASINPELLSK